MPSLLPVKVTKDGRVRAQWHDVTAKRRQRYPYGRVAVACVALIFMWKRGYSQAFERKPALRFLDKVQIVEHGVLGTTFTMRGGLEQRAAGPDSQTVIVDPLDMDQIAHPVASVGGTSGAIYNWLGLTGFLPERVQQSLFRSADAKYFSYNDNQKVIHVVVPDFRKGKWSEREASLELAKAYRNVLHEFVLSDATKLRLVPICDGVWSGELTDQLPAITQQALVSGFQQLHFYDKEHVLKEEKAIEMCLFREKQFVTFKNAFETLTVSTAL